MTTAQSLLADLAIAMKQELKSNWGWLEDGAAFANDSVIDGKDAEFHLRALQRILTLNQMQKGQP